MKNVFLFLISICLLCTCYRTNTSNDPLNHQIAEYIRKNCREDTPCSFSVKDAVNLPWDQFFVFDSGVGDDIIRQVLNKKVFSDSPYYSRKWFFTKDNQIVFSEEQILYEVNKPVKDGDVVFDIKDSTKKYAVFQPDSVFTLERGKTATGEFYNLYCTNCK